MTVVPGARLGPYEITAKLGEGGMGEVYRATDTKLKREVAIKVLPAAFTADKERLARFEREAQLLAQLNHPNIAAIHGLEESEGVRALVMELVEGPTLAERLESGPLSFTESLSFALQIAQALEEAHEKGIVHRDLKPQNIKASSEGKVKVLDFGLAKAMDPAAGSAVSATDLARSPTMMQSPTLTAAHGTQLGVILGTAAYMAPEQARGVAVDKRADIWAFGVVLFEMLTGRRLFEGELVTDVLASVLRKEIDFEVLPAETPGAIRRLLRRCLERNPKNRLHDIADARIVLAEVQTGSVAEPERELPEVRRGAAAWLPWAVAAVAVVAAVALAVLGSFSPGARSAAVASAPIVRTSILLPASARDSLVGGMFALSPDGGAVAFVAPAESGESLLWVRELAEPVPRPLAGTEGAFVFPFWSFDGREIGFLADGRLRRVPRFGGAVQAICDASTLRGAAWGPDGTILFSASPFAALLRVPASGGAPVPATVLDAAKGERSHRFPSFLPDGRHFLFAVEPPIDRNRIQIKIASLDEVSSGRPVLVAETAPRFAPPAQLVFSRGQALLTQELDLERLEVVGEPRLLADEPEVGGGFSSTPAVELSRAGAMLHIGRDARPTEIAWLDRNGRSGPIVGRSEGSFAATAISPRGDRMVTSLREPGEGSALWVFDLLHGSGSRVTPRGSDVYPGVWSADGREIAAVLSREGSHSLVWIDPDSGREREILAPSRVWRVVLALSGDGRLLLFSTLNPRGDYDLGFVRLGAAAASAVYLETPANETGATLSPDGEWIAYLSDASGRQELYVDRFPEPAGARRIVTQGAVMGVQWQAAGGGSLFFFVSESGRAVLYSASVRTNPTLELGTPRRLFELPTEWRDLVVAPDGERFLLLRPVGERPVALTLVQNWNAAPAGTR